MSLKSLLLSAVALSFMAAPAAALELANNDDAGYEVEVVVGEGDNSVQKYELNADEVLSEICMQGCTIKLSSGAEQTFAGDEMVSVKDGQFVIAE